MIPTVPEEADVLYHHHCCGIGIAIYKFPDGSVGYTVVGHPHNKDQEIKIPSGFTLQEVEGKKVSTGKVTGVQLRAIHAADQMQAMLSNDMFGRISKLAHASREELYELLQNEEIFYPVVGMMALFCYLEIKERQKSGEPKE